MAEPRAARTRRAAKGAAADQGQRAAEAEAEAEAEPRTGDGGSLPAGWRGEASAWTLLASALLGLGISAYLTTLHYAGVPPLCSTGGPIDCGLVVASSYSLVPGTQLPVTVPGMLWFLVSGGLTVMSLRSQRRGLAEPDWLRPSHAAWAVLGLISVFYLVYAEVALRAICEWCTGVHLLVFLSLLVTLARLRRPGPLVAR